MNQFSRYLVVGVVNTLVGYGIIFTCMYLAGMSPATSNFIGYVIGLMVSYVLNKYFTFNSRKKSAKEAIGFLAVFAVAYSANLGMLLFEIDIFGMPKGVSQIGAGVVYTLTSYVLNKRFVFTGAEHV